MSLFWIANPLIVLSSKKYLPPKNSAIIFENNDILLNLSFYLEDEDLLDFLSVLFFFQYYEKSIIFHFVGQ